jgi:hypothetical protein
MRCNSCEKEITDNSQLIFCTDCSGYKDHVKKKVFPKIRMFDPVIYPFKIWIIIDKKPDIIAENFREYDGKKVIFTDDDGTKRQEAFSMMVQNDEYYGAVIYFRSKESICYELAAHEASHTAKHISEHIGADTRPHEYFEYLVGWIAKCIEKVKNNKP